MPPKTQKQSPHHYQYKPSSFLKYLCRPILLGFLLLFSRELCANCIPQQLTLEEHDHAITAEDYTLFLNTFTVLDPTNLYDQKIEKDTANSCITRTGSPGGYLYEAIPGKETAPVSFISWEEAAQYCQWKNVSPLPNNTTPSWRFSSCDKAFASADHFLKSNRLTFSITNDLTSYGSLAPAAATAELEESLCVEGEALLALVASGMAMSTPERQSEEVREPLTPLHEALEALPQQASPTGISTPLSERTLAQQLEEARERYEEAKKEHEEASRDFKETSLLYDHLKEGLLEDVQHSLTAYNSELARYKNISSKTQQAYLEHCSSLSTLQMSFGLGKTEASIWQLHQIMAEKQTDWVAHSLEQRRSLFSLNKLGFTYFSLWNQWHNPAREGLVRQILGECQEAAAWCDQTKYFLVAQKEELSSLVTKQRLQESIATTAHLIEQELEPFASKMSPEKKTRFFEDCTKAITSSQNNPIAPLTAAAILDLISHKIELLKTELEHDSLREKPEKIIDQTLLEPPLIEKKSETVEEKFKCLDHLMDMWETEEEYDQGMEKFVAALRELHQRTEDPIVIEQGLLKIIAMLEAETLEKHKKQIYPLTQKVAAPAITETRGEEPQEDSNEKVLGELLETKKTTLSSAASIKNKKKRAAKKRKSENKLIFSDELQEEAPLAEEEDPHLPHLEEYAYKIFLNNEHLVAKLCSESRTQEEYQQKVSALIDAEYEKHKAAFKKQEHEKANSIDPALALASSTQAEEELLALLKKENLQQKTASSKKQPKKAMK